MRHLATVLTMLAGIHMIPAAPAAGEEARPARQLKERLYFGTGSKKREVNEGRRMIAEEDSYPREPAKIAEGPTVTKKDGGFAIRFALDRPDDVLVRIVDPNGNTVRHIVSGVLGWNAPEPLVPDSLSQEILWDGKDAAGKPAPAGCRVRVAVGLAPRFDGFVAHDPEQILPDISGIEVDHKGRVYVAIVGRGKKGDAHLIRYDREGKYLETAFPPNPNGLTESLEKVHRKVHYVDGRALPARMGFWPDFMWRLKNGTDKTDRHYPLEIAADGTAYMADPHCSKTWVRNDEKGKIAYVKNDEKLGHSYGRMRIMPVQLDPYWWLDYGGRESGHWTLDPKGCFAYVVRGHPQNGFVKLPQVWKLTPDPWAVASDFEYNGNEKLAAKRYWIGDRPARGQKIKAADALFNRIIDIDTDEAGNLFLADARAKGDGEFPPTQLKVFGPDGKLAGVIEEIEPGGTKEPLGDVYGIAVAKQALYVVTRNDPQGKKGVIASWQHGRVVKFKRTDGTALEAVWTTPVDPTAHLVAVDENASPPLVWVGNGGGPATFTRIVDNGEKPGEVRHCGSGVRKGILVDPWAIALDGKGCIYVYDQARNVIVRTNDDGSEWIESAPLEWGQTSFLADRQRDLLYFITEKGIGRIDRDLSKPEKFARTINGRRSTLGGIDADGNLLVGDGYGRFAKDAPKDAMGIGRVSVFGPDGSATKNDLCTTYSVPGSIALDSRRFIYLTDVPIADIKRASHNLTITHPEPWYRGERFTETQPDFTYLAKFPPSGGARCGEKELWAHLGVSPVNAGMCGNCTVASRTLAIDGADRIYALNYAQYHVKVLDTAGNMITRVGAWGNAECRGPESAFPNPEIAFWTVYCIDAGGDHLYASDRDLRRIVKVRMDYRETKEAAL